MNNKYVQYFPIIIFVLLLKNSPLIADMAEAKMAAPQPTSSIDVVSFYKTEQGKRKLTSHETEILNLASFAQDVFGVKEFYSFGHHATAAEKAKAIDLNSIANSIRNAIQLRQNWDQSIPTEHKVKIKQTSESLKKALGENSYSWAWFLYQNGNKNESKTILVQGFEKSYSETMKLTQIGGFRNSNPMYNADLISKALTSMSTKEENKSREDQLQKMRLHVSSLPNMQMMT